MSESSLQPPHRGQRRHYPAHVKQQALDRMANRGGEKLAKVARDLDVPEGTLSAWWSHHRRTADDGAHGGRRRVPAVSFASDDHGSLVRFATFVLLEAGGLPREDIAVRVGARRPRTTSLYLNEAAAPDLGPAPSLVLAVDRTVQLSTRYPPQADPPRLVELYEEVLGHPPGEPTHVPATWFDDLASVPASTTTHVFARGEALYSLVKDLRSTSQLERVLGEASQKVHDTVAQLYAVAVRSPRVGGRAIHMLSRLGLLALDPDGRGHTYARTVLSRSPIGYRAMRVAGRLLSQSQRHGADKGPPLLHIGVEDAVLGLLRDVHVAPPPEIYPQRSLVVEALFKVRRDFDVVDAFVSQSLALRALNRLEGADTRPFRERAYAAVVLAERAAPELREVKAEFSRLAADGDPGFQYALQQLEVLDRTDRGGEGMIDLPELPDAAEVKLVRGATQEAIETWRYGEIAVPRQAKSGVAKLLSCALLDLHGTRRRYALDTLRHSGLGPLLSATALDVAFRTDAPSWLRAQSAFAAGFSLDGEALVPLVRLATDPVASDDEVRVAALHACGDIGLVAHRHSTELGALNDLTRQRLAMERGVDQVLQAATYAVATTRFQGREPSGDAVGAILRRVVSATPDPLAARMAQWGLLRLERLKARAVDRVTPAVVEVPGQ